MKETFSILYRSESEKHVTRYQQIANRFAQEFGRQWTGFFSTPGRTEIGGNHTDHNGGRVLAAAVNLDMVSSVAPRDDNIVHIVSKGFSDIKISITNLDPVPCEKESPSAIVRGTCAGFSSKGYSIGGFDAYFESDVAVGSGLSSSAAFEVQIACILNHLYNNGKIPPLTLAKIAKYAENDYYGKPCGLMDMTACATGGFMQIDFEHPDDPKIKKINFDFENSGYSLVIVFPGKGHDDLSGEYRDLESEMKQVAKALGGKTLRDCSWEILMQNISRLPGEVSDRAILRAIHFYSEDERVRQQTKCLESADFEAFLDLVNDSGRSSWMYCQNVYSHSNIHKQELSLALALSEQLLKNKGAWRIHGGGFGGTIQSFVPDDMRDEYIEKMDGVFGKGSCQNLTIRKHGTVKVESVPL